MSEHGIAQSVEAYNARWLTAAQVASTFVPPSQFGELAKHRHTILVGPRGSGKTTLLKMLQPAALEYWKGVEADSYRESITYTGIFIPADISWRQQIDSANSCVKNDGQRVLLSNATFTAHVLQAIVETMCFRIAKVREGVITPFKHCVLEKEKEALIAQEISKIFLVKPSIPTLLSLKHAIAARLSEIRLISEKTAHSANGISIDNFSDYPFIFIDPLVAAGSAIAVFDDVCEDPDGKWALLFDELEIAPEAIQINLIQGTRSSNPKFLFKLALSPISSCSTSVPTNASPSPNNDFDQLQLWYAHKEQRGASRRKKQFCLDLWNSMTLSRGLSSSTPISFFGKGLFEQENERDLGRTQTLALSEKKRDNPYGQNGMWGKRFISLYQSDPTFKQYLDERNIKPDRILDLPLPVRDSAIRKAAPIVAVREFYRRPASPGSQNAAGRSRKSIELYTGADALFDISEGHPRWFKVMMARLLDQASGAATLRVGNTIQGQELLAASQRFAALLKTYPIEPGNISESGRGLLSLIEAIARYFHDQVVKAPFTPEPNLSFIVDSHVSEQLHYSLAQALNLGAIVYVPDGDGEVLLTSLRGKRFRISYWLAPLYGLPLILGKAISLSTILQGKQPARLNQSPQKSLDLSFDAER